MHALPRTHICAHTYVPSRARLARAARHPPEHAPACRRGRCERGGGGTHSCFRLGHSAAAGSAASSVLYAHLRANRAAAPGGSGPPRPRAGRPRAPAMLARGSAAPTTGNADAAASNAAWRGPARGAAAHAQQRSAGTAANAHSGGAAGVGRTVPPRACTGRATRGAPSPSCSGSTCRAPRARAARARAQPTDGRGDERAEATESRHACTHTHAHARDG
jgi:hypothetical protein